MPLHNTEELKAPPTSPIEAEVLNCRTETYEFREIKQDPQAVYQTIHDQLVLDGKSQQNLATFCTTWIEPEVKLLMDESADKNMIDKDEYPQTAAIEERCVHMLADLWNSPEAASTIGWFPPIPCRPIARIWSSSASSYATASRVKWPTSFCSNCKAYSTVGRTSGKRIAEPCARRCRVQLPRSFRPIGR